MSATPEREQAEALREAREFLEWYENRSGDYHEHLGDAYREMARVYREFVAAVEREDAHDEEMLRLNAEHLKTLEGIRDAEGDEWKAHIIDGICHYNLTYAEQYTAWKHRARLAEERVEKAAAALGRADDLLRRLSEWDVLNLAPGSGDDGPYWQREIAKVREALAGGVSAAGRPPEPDPASLSVTQGGIGDTAGFFLPPEETP